ncbi:hypothetical protein [Streptococcus pneumoniae]|uniref:hypothetical protein n=1 Tax=Streptococcus pneumoniae TaxID=1313 RepID=UPI000B6EE1B1|nr:hypothetical protein [Streptococcus pneumoniae]SNM05827.1 chlorohydrolase [Streptococcus pneumoniae]
MDETDEVSSKHGLLTWFEEIFEELTKSVTYTYGKATLTWFEEIFEEYALIKFVNIMSLL